VREKIVNLDAPPVAAQPLKTGQGERILWRSVTRRESCAITARVHFIKERQRWYQLATLEQVLRGAIHRCAVALAEHEPPSQS
jgi:hypothetical protein